MFATSICKTMSIKNNVIFKFLLVIAWIIFVGLSIEAGGLIVNFIFSVFKPEVVANLYQKLDLSKLYGQNQAAFYNVYSFVLALSILKAFLFYKVVMLLHRMDLTHPFSEYVARTISSIAYFTFSIGLISVIAREYARNLNNHGYPTDNLHQFWTDGRAFILMAAVVYVIAQIFKRGVELQSENDLTV